jgi:hypothetical protein
MSQETITRQIPLMAMPQEPVQQPRWAMRLGRSVRAVKRGTVRVLGANVPASLGHLREHAYALMGLGSLSAAGFVHSTFAGLLVMGAGFLVFEFKISPED